MRIRGKTTIFLRALSEIQWGEDGIATGRAVYHIADYSRAISAARSIGNHPRHGFMNRKTRTVIRQVAKGADIVIDFSGQVEEPDTNYLDVSVQTTLREAAITTHPKFVEWAGSPKNPKEGVFDADGRFVAWVPGSEFVGQESWLQPAMSVTVETYENGEPDFTQVGKVVNSAQGLPSIGSRSWMIMGIPYRTSPSGGFYVGRQYQMSGPKGWNLRVYNEVD